MEAGLPDFGRFSEPALLVLAGLSTGPKHGYALILEIERLRGVRLGSGTLYGALQRLEERGWVEALPEEDRRHPYKITPQGQGVLEAHLRSFRKFADEILGGLEPA